MKKFKKIIMIYITAAVLFTMSGCNYSFYITPIPKTPPINSQPAAEQTPAQETPASTPTEMPEPTLTPEANTPTPPLEVEETPTPPIEETQTPELTPTPTPEPQGPDIDWNVHVNDYIDIGQGFLSANMSDYNNDTNVRDNIKRAIDNNIETDMVLDFDSKSGNSIILRVSSAAYSYMLFSGYTLTTSAADVGGTPVSWKLYGMPAGGKEFILIDIVTGGMPDTEAAESGIFFIDLPGKYEQLRFEFENIADPGSAQICISEIKLIAEASYYNDGSIDFTMLNNYVDKDSIKVNSAKNFENADNLFSLNVSDKFLCDISDSENSGTWNCLTIEWAMLQPVRMKYYRFYVTASPQAIGAVVPYKWKLYGTTVDGKEILIHEVYDSMLSWTNGNSEIYEVNRPGVYISFRIEFTDYYGYRNDEKNEYSSAFNVGAFYLFNDREAPEPGLYDDYEILNDLVDLDSVSMEPCTDSDIENETARKGFDWNEDTLVEFSKEWYEADSFVYKWRMKTPVVIMMYSIDASSDKIDPADRPKSWVLYGSNSADELGVVLSTVEDAEGTERGTVYEVENPGEYEYYTIVFTENYSDNVNILFGEIIMLLNK